MNYSGKRLRILLDSTYLLPMLGVDVNDIRDVIVGLKKLYDEGKATYYYSPYSLLEILGKISKSTYNEHRLRLGLTAIEEKFTKILPTINGYIKALKLKTKGFRDLIDLLLYTTAETNSILFLTRDKELVDFLLEHGENTSIILLEEQVHEIL